MIDDIQERFYPREEYAQTTNSYVFRKLYKEKYASCSYCTWHPRWFGRYCENDKWPYYCVDEDPDVKWNITKTPNWKLCSKNRKQWMKKPLKLKKTRRWRNEHPLFVIEW